MNPLLISPLESQVSRSVSLTLVVNPTQKCTSCGFLWVRGAGSQPLEPSYRGIAKGMKLERHANPQMLMYLNL